MTASERIRDLDLGYVNDFRYGEVRPNAVVQIAPDT